MKKEELITKIGDVVMKNSKNGKLTTTKFVGTYNYKSGYDTYFAVSLDINMALIVYSYYQNDRGEHIDTCKYKLADLKENELKEVYDNLNTEDKDVLQYVGWTNTEEENLEIIKHLGIYNPKPKKAKKLSVDDIPELENPDDAYVVDRNNNISILKCAGKSPSGKKIFVVEKNKNGVYEQPLYDNKTYTFCATGKFQKNKGIFMISGGRETSDDKYVFAPDKKTLIKLINEANEIKEYYLVNDKDLSTSKTEREGDYRTQGDWTGFTTKEEAVEHFNKVKTKKIKSLTNLKERLENRIAEAKDSTNGVELLEFNDVHIKYENAKPGQMYFIYWGDEYYGPHKLTKLENGIAYFDNGYVLGKWERVITPENLEKYKASEKFKKTKEHIDECLGELNWVEKALKTANSIVPFLKSDDYIPEWIEQDAKKILKKSIPVLSKVTA